MADVTVPVTGFQFIVNPNPWDSELTWGWGTYGRGGAITSDLIQGWGHLSWGQA